MRLPIIVFSFFLVSCSPNWFKKTSKEIDQTRDYENYQMYSPFFHHYRLKLENQNELDFLNPSLDTFFVHEILITELSPLMAGAIWNQKGSVNYAFIGKERQPDTVLNFKDQDLINYTLSDIGPVEKYFRGLPEHTVKNRHYFEKVAVSQGKFKILTREAFDY